VLTYYEDARIISEAIGVHSNSNAAKQIVIGFNLFSSIQRGKDNHIMRKFGQVFSIQHSAFRFVQEHTSMGKCLYVSFGRKK
jgi:hypothetical protein